MTQATSKRRGHGEDSIHWDDVRTVIFNGLPALWPKSEPRPT